MRREAGGGGGEAARQSAARRRAWLFVGLLSASHIPLRRPPPSVKQRATPTCSCTYIQASKRRTNPLLPLQGYSRAPGCAPAAP